MRLTLGQLRDLLTEAVEQIDISSLPPVLYHVTSDKNVESIKSNGLEPRASKNFGYEPRIFLADSVEAALDMFEWLPHPGIAELFKVTLAQLSPDTVFYDDTAAGKGCYWTPNPIPPTAIEQVPLDD